MNDMTGGGVGAPEAPFSLADAIQDDAVRAALERMVRNEQNGRLDEVDFASKMLWSYVGDLEKRWQELEAQEKFSLTDKDFKQGLAAARDVRDAAKFLAEERTRVEKLRKDIAGTVGGGSLDLDSARDEIGRRLACLRRAG